MPDAVHSLAAVPLFDRLAARRRVIVAGAGGGFDVFAGLPLYLALRGAGKDVHLANLTFTYLGGTDARWLAPHVAEVTAETSGEDGYFPERRLAEWLRARGEPAPVYAFEKVGVAPLRRAWQTLVERLEPDAVVLVDGGTDILMRGDEAGLGTPAEDMVSLAAVSGLDVAERLVVCLGFGVDTFHGVCHAHFLENVAALARAGGFLGAFSLLREMPEAQGFLDAVAFAEERTPARPSIVNGSIAAAVGGRFGDVDLGERTRSSELFINPLMTLFFAFDLAAVAAASLYLPLLEGTRSIFEVQARIEGFRKSVAIRPRRAIPH
ncbi:MAG TPA: DUF1152 domain-containing protein [Kofleriaceae bacterium]|nr:DUF1152 domain-containing protein [Kofleriaceae bacterium]